MAVHKLILEDAFDEVMYTLIGIHCNLEDYRLAYLLNKRIGINLIRKPCDLDFKKTKSSYSIFEWEDKKQLITWSLVSNICKTEEYKEVNYKSLFDIPEKITKTFNLIPEYKKVNFFLKIDTVFNSNTEIEILNNIKSIMQIATAYSIDPNQLKTKDNLIFN